MNELMTRKMKEVFLKKAPLFLYAMLLFAWIPEQVNAQTQSAERKITITGKVMDSTGELLPGVSVTQKGKRTEQPQTWTVILR